MDEHHAKIERGLDEMIEQASLYGNVSDELLPYRAKIVAAFDAGASAQKIADFLSATLGKKISKDRVLRFCERHGAKRKRIRRAPDGFGATPAEALPQAPRPARRGGRGGGATGANAAAPSPQTPASDAQPGPPAPGTPAGTVTRIQRRTA